MAHVSDGTVASGEGTSLSPGAPGGSAEDDVWVCHVGDTASGVSISMSGDWTERIQEEYWPGDSEGRMAVFEHVYDGVTTPDLTVNFGSTATAIAKISAFSGRNTSAPFDGRNTRVDGSGSSISYNDHTPGEADCDAVTFRVTNNDRLTNSAPSGYTEMLNAKEIAGADVSASAHYDEAVPATTISGLTEGFAGAGLTGGIIYTLAPAAGGGPAANPKGALGGLVFGGPFGGPVG